MRIRQIAVDGLFGIFDHAIPMKMEDRITIIHGPNGFGKTVLLNMIDALLTGRHSQLRSVPFRSLRVDFDEHRTLRVKRDQNGAEKRNGPIAQLTFEFTEGNSKKKTFAPKRAERPRYHFPLAAIESEIPELARIGPESWVHLPTQEELSLEEVMERFGEQFPLQYEPVEREPPWLADIRKAIPVRFIETQRLLRMPRSRRRSVPNERRPMEPAVVTYAQELAATIKATLAEYANLSQSLDRSFPTRLVSSDASTDLTTDDLRNELSALEDKRSRLVDAGLLDREKGLDFRQLHAIDERNRNVLSVYVTDAQQKLSVFDEISKKLDLFKQIIKDRFLYKEMVITSKDGLVFRTADGKTLQPTFLSSGEQHVVVLFYELLFKVGPNSLILIDEPELSLHVIWQQQFLQALANITKLGNFDVLIATHSPQIIHDRWDLTVELKGPTS